MKYIVIVPDGMWDHPIEELGNKTPLEVAHTTNMDYLAQNGMTGLVKTIPDGMKPGSDVGNLSIMGYNPRDYLSGRAPLEAANMGVDLADNEIAFRCNLVTIANNIMQDYSAGHIRTEEASILIDALNNSINERGVRFVAGKSYRHLLILRVRNPEEYARIKCTPPHDISDENISAYLPSGKGSQLLLRLMEKAQAILENHSINTVRADLKENPANRIWLWGQGTRIQLPSFKEKFGLEGGIISAVDLVNGIGRLAGLEIIQVPGITGYYDTNYRGKAEYALNFLKKKDFCFIHIEGTDEAGHNGDLKNKIFCIEQIDREIVGPIINHFGKDDEVRILILPDHPTPVELKTHTSDPVGFIMFGKRIPQDGSQEYSETVSKEQGLKFESGEKLMEDFINRYTS